MNIFFVNAYVTIKGPDSPSLQFKELLENEKSNFRLVNTAVSYLGGVPAMINPADMSNTIPSEKVWHKGFLTNLFPPWFCVSQESEVGLVVYFFFTSSFSLNFVQTSFLPSVFQVVMSYLSFLCARLLDLRNETRAARVIQGAWRKYRLKKDVELYKVCSPLWPSSNKHIFITFFSQKYVRFCRFFLFILQLCDANFVSDLAVALVSRVKENILICQM